MSNLGLSLSRDLSLQAEVEDRSVGFNTTAYLSLQAEVEGRENQSYIESAEVQCFQQCLDSLAVDQEYKKVKLELLTSWR
eukprot:scaffold1392_cov86-Skeletonema_menzelii.AAC.9